MRVVLAVAVALGCGTAAAHAQRNTDFYYARPAAAWGLPAGGSGCTGYVRPTFATAGGAGCTGSFARPAYGYYGSSCQGSAGMGLGAYQVQPARVTYEFAPPAPPPAARVRVTEYELPAPAPVVPRAVPCEVQAQVLPAPAQAAGVYGDVYAVPTAPQGARYGAKLAPGVYNTPSGRQAAPGILSDPGAAWPADGPIRRFFRRGLGYDQ